MARELDNREKLFMAEYLLTKDPRGAALKAGYSATVAKTSAFKWVTPHKHKVPKGKLPLWEAIHKEIQAHAKKCGIDAEKLLEVLAARLDADIADMFEEDNTLRDVRKWPMPFRKGGVISIETECRDKGKTVVTKVKLASRDKIIELTGRHVQVKAWERDIGAGEVHIHLDSKDAKA